MNVDGSIGLEKVTLTDWTGSMRGLVTGGIGAIVGATVSTVKVAVRG